MTDTPRKAVLTLGDVNPDIILPLNSDPDALLRASVSGGGTVANVASGLGKLGIPVSFCGKTGDDAFGHHMDRLLQDDGVDTTHLIFEKESFTNMVFGVIGTDGERTIFVWPPDGAAQSKLLRDDLSFSKEPYSQLHISTINMREEPSADAILWCAESLIDSHVTTTFDLNLRMEFFEDDTRFQGYLERALKASDIIFGSAQDEIIPLTGINDPEKAAKSLAEGKTVIARMGAEGSLCITDEKTTYIPAYEVPVLDTIGAGDAFDSGFIAALNLGLTPETATVWGTGCAAVSITRQNARSCPNREELFSFFESQHDPKRYRELIDEN